MDKATSADILTIYNQVLKAEQENKDSGFYFHRIPDANGMQHRVLTSDLFNLTQYINDQNLTIQQQLSHADDLQTKLDDCTKKSGWYSSAKARLEDRNNT